MKPRVFVSSTYYDLKHVRERIEKFIDNYGFESVLFESDKITYEHNKPIDSSAYHEVNLCHIMILIIGGRYGTPTTNNNLVEERKKYETEFVSITRKEFETAVEKNLPIFIFIDKNVYSDYQTFKENQVFFEQYRPITKESNINFKFAHVDSINIFHFIDLVKTKAIKTFEKVEEIENYLQNQISGMFYLYLENLQKKSEVDKVLDTVSELNNISLRMNEMLNSVGKKILANDSDEYVKVIEKQFDLIIDFFADQFYELVEIVELEYDDIENYDNYVTKDMKFKIIEIIFDKVLNTNLSIPENIRERENWSKQTEKKILKDINDELSNLKIPVEIFYIAVYRLHVIYTLKIKEFINDEESKKKLFNRLFEEIDLII